MDWFHLCLLQAVLKVWIVSVALWSQLSSSLLPLLQTPSKLAYFIGAQFGTPISLWKLCKKGVTLCQQLSQLNRGTHTMFFQLPICLISPQITLLNLTLEFFPSWCELYTVHHFKKSITSMDSPHRELFSDILFAKFRCRLSHFPFSIWFFCWEIESEREKSRQGRKEEGSALWGPVAVKEMRENQRRVIVWFGFDSDNYDEEPFDFDASDTDDDNGNELFSNSYEIWWYMMSNLGLVIVFM
jgi:hypothetical protein